MSDNTPATVRALCCECGNLRTVSASHRRRDENYAAEFSDHRRGWRMTTTLKCPVCEQPTRHAVLRDDTPETRDSVERDEHDAAAAQYRRLECDAVLSRVASASSVDALWQYLRLRTSTPANHRQLTRLHELIGGRIFGEVKEGDFTEADATFLIDFLLYVRDRDRGRLNSDG